jgi:hypothetical protein
MVRLQQSIESTIKEYNSMIHTQSAVHCMVELAKQNKIDPGKCRRGRQNLRRDLFPATL